MAHPKPRCTGRHLIPTLPNKCNFEAITFHFPLMFQKTVMTWKSNDRYNFLLLLLEKCKHINQFKQIHAQILKSGLSQTPFPASRLLFSVASHSHLFDYAHSIFENLPNRNTFMYNTMIRCHAQTGDPIPAILCYIDMLKHGVLVNNYTFPPLIKACTLLLPDSKLLGRSIHAHSVESGYSNDGFILSALVEFYSLVLDTEMSRKLFDGCVEKDVVLWTAMIDGYAKISKIEKARELFDEMPERNVISWSAMIAGYLRVSDFEEVLCLFRRMQESGFTPNDSALVTVITACAHLGAFAQGVWIHSYTKRQGLDSNLILGTAITDMYAKCGHMESALHVFKEIPSKDLRAWNAIISGFAMNGDAERSIELFNNMCVHGMQPNEGTFVAVLSACAHAGMVEKGLELFHQMCEIYNVKPQLEHYACMVDLLARAGHLEEAEKVIEGKMGSFGGGDVNVWGALLNACRVYGNVEIGDRVWKKIAQLGIADCGFYVLVYNIYREAGWQMEANRVRRMITEEGLKKKPGCSLIEVDGMVDEFIAGNFSHPQGREILEMLDSLIKVVGLEGWF